jgi:hypothetical protein
MKEFFGVDESSGLTYYTEQVDDLTTIRSEQDVEPVMELAKIERDQRLRDEKGIAGHIRHYCYLPASIMLELYKKGINMMNPQESDWQKFFKEMETNYPKFKTTEMKAWRPH